MERALPEEELRVFLRRRRRGPTAVHPPIGQWIAETMNLAARLVPCDSGWLLLDDPTRDRPGSPLTVVAAFGPSAGDVVGLETPAGNDIVGKVYQSGEIHTTDGHNEKRKFLAKADRGEGIRARSVLAVPVLLEQTVSGVFALANCRHKEGFDERDLELAKLLAQHVSRSILNAVDMLKQNHLALHDDLTGVRNVRGLEGILDRAVSDARRDGTDTAVLFVDVDRLKEINDRFGHVAGSEALRRVAHRLEAELEDRGTIFRFGGDEFVVVCPGMDAAAAEALGDDLRRAVSRGKAGKKSAVSVSVGVATLGTSLRNDAPRGSEARRLLRAADRALYRAKARGRNRTMRATRRDDTLGRKPK